MESWLGWSTRTTTQTTTQTIRMTIQHVWKRNAHSWWPARMSCFRVSRYSAVQCSAQWAAKLLHSSIQKLVKIQCSFFEHWIFTSFWIGNFELYVNSSGWFWTPASPHENAHTRRPPTSKHQKRPHKKGMLDELRFHQNFGYIASKIIMKQCKTIISTFLHHSFCAWFWDHSDHSGLCVYITL